MNDEDSFRVIDALRIENDALRAAIHDAAAIIMAAVDIMPQDDLQRWMDASPIGIRGWLELHAPASQEPA